MQTQPPIAAQSEPVILHPAAWTVLIIGAIIVVWFTMQDDDPDTF